MGKSMRVLVLCTVALVAAPVGAAQASGPDPNTCTGTVVYNPSVVAATSANWHLVCGVAPGAVANDDSGTYDITTTFAPPAVCSAPAQGTIVSVSGSTPQEGFITGGSGSYITNNALFVFFDFKTVLGGPEDHHAVLQAPCSSPGAVSGAITD